MESVTVSAPRQAQQRDISPAYARISMAAAITLGLKPGRFLRDCACGCINLLQVYPEGCFANCAYCGLARKRPGAPESNSFIRVAWPVYSTALIARCIAEKDRREEVGRVCISQVQDHRANGDLLSMVEVVHEAAPRVPIAALVNATTMDAAWLARLKEAGVTNIGIGLDGASPEIFERRRGRAAGGPHTWARHRDVARLAQSMFGPWNVNCHVIVGLGETDRDLIRLFESLKRECISAYLFSFNPEAGTAMQDVPRQPITRHRRIQLAKHLIETGGIDGSSIAHDTRGLIAGFDANPHLIHEAVRSGVPFMTNGCPDRHGSLACNRPYGSYRPGEEYRDYPFQPGNEDLHEIRWQLKLEEICPAFA